MGGSTYFGKVSKRGGILRKGNRVEKGERPAQKSLMLESKTQKLKKRAVAAKRSQEEKNFEKKMSQCKEPKGDRGGGGRDVIGPRTSEPDSLAQTKIRLAVEVTKEGQNRNSKGGTKRMEGTLS